DVNPLLHRREVRLRVAVFAPVCIPLPILRFLCAGIGRRGLPFLLVDGPIFYSGPSGRRSVLLHRQYRGLVRHRAAPVAEGVLVAKPVRVLPVIDETVFTRVMLDVVHLTALVSLEMTANRR